MAFLNDASIREALIRRLRSMSKTPRVVLEELRVHNGNAIADVVAINDFAHCYEIKGDNDSILRAVKQSHYYDLVFRRTTLVTTEKHLQRALLLMPTHWGLICARLRNQDVKLSYVRAARNNLGFDKKLAVMTLWKSEMVEVATPLNIKNANKLNREQLSEAIASNFSADDLVKSIGNSLTLRAGLNREISQHVGYM
ncbi:sce7726 family protein [Bordetella trematum]|uniref:sce7726 family protein n=1 Tax=Bordetella trematum TaxID=123899 RepID=UPI003AF33BF4